MQRYVYNCDDLLSYNIILYFSFKSQKLCTWVITIFWVFATHVFHGCDAWTPQYSIKWYFIFINNRPLALRGHVTNASFKQWVGILLMRKIDRAHENYHTPEIWEVTHLREIFYGTLIFQQSSMICITRHVGGHTLALQHDGQNYFMLICC